MSNTINQYLDITRLIERLRSSTNSERELSKKQLIEFGSDAIYPLLDLLSDLTNNPFPRFQMEEEKEGQAEVESFCLLLKREGFASPNVATAHGRIAKLEINERLCKDIVYLLGELKAKEAIPILIKRMEFLGTYGQPYAYTEEMVALQTIGLVAVPHLIKEIREAESRVRSSSIEWVDFQSHTNFNLSEEKQIESTGSTSKKNKADRDADFYSELEIQMVTHNLQNRVLLIFKKMKDRRTIPYLKELLKETQDKGLISSIETTIALIESSKLTLPSGSIRVGVGDSE